jgi:hypothetical protein
MTSNIHFVFGKYVWFGLRSGRLRLIKKMGLLAVPAPLYWMSHYFWTEES